MEQFKKVQVILIPTENKENALWSYKERRLYSNEDANFNDEDYVKYYHLYFLSEDVVKENDYFYPKKHINVHKSKGINSISGDIESDNGLCYDITKCKKIIATTDTSLSLTCKCGNIKKVNTGLCTECGKFSIIPLLPLLF